jgi:hypothetical protein
MNLALCWKEWREHWLIWLAVAVVAVASAGGTYVVIATPGAGFLQADHALQQVLLTTLLILAVTYGLVCGGMMFAGEREAGTLAFLDMTAGERFTVWRTKAVAGAVLTVAQTLVLLAVDLALGLSRAGGDFWGWVAELFVFALSAYAWGLCASALCRTTLGAAGLGALFLLASWFLIAVLAFGVAMIKRSIEGVELVLGESIAAAGAVLVSRQIYCRADRERRRSPVQPARRQTWEQAGVRATLWLCWTQGRVLMATLAGAALVLGLLLPVKGVTLWPIGTLLVGAVCGLAVFVPDQLASAYRFLGVQRLPPGRVWAIKVLCWLAVAVGVAVLIFLAACARASATATGTQQSFGTPGGLMAWLRANQVISQEVPAGLFLTVWLVYGFCVGQLVALLSRKTIVAVMLGLPASAAVAGLWIPSLLLGGVFWWQVLGVPVLLLVATRLRMRAWTADRLYTRWPLLALLGYGVLATAWTAGGLWYRVVEVPDVGEPFDVEVFTASLATPEKQEVGRLFRQAALALRDWENWATWRVGPPGSLPVPEQAKGLAWRAEIPAAPGGMPGIEPRQPLMVGWAEIPAAPGGMPGIEPKQPLMAGEQTPEGMETGSVLGASTLGLLGSPLGEGPLVAASALFPGRTEIEMELANAAGSYGSYSDQVGWVIQWGWPTRPSQLVRWLDRLFEGKWVEDYRAAAEAPLGVVADPRRLNYVTTQDVQTGADVARLFVARALQLQARGKDGKALDHLLTALGLSRQLRNDAPSSAYRAGAGAEAAALDGLQHWLRQLGPRQDLLKRALEGLTRHEIQTPPVTGCIKAEYLVLRDTLSSLRAAAPRESLEARLILLAREVPWEKGRERRLVNALFVSELRLAGRPLRLAGRPTWEVSRQQISAGEVASFRYVPEMASDLEQDSGTRLSRRQWERLLATAWVTGFLSRTYMRPVLETSAYSQCRVRAARLQVALALYQVQQGRPAASLQDLVPRYLAAVPRDPFSGKPFSYRVSQGEPPADKPDAAATDPGAPRIPAGQGVLSCADKMQHEFLVPIWPKR